MKWNRLSITFGIIIVGICSLLLYGSDKAEGAGWKLFQATSATNGAVKEDYETPSEWTRVTQNSVTNYLTGFYVVRKGEVFYS